MSRAYHQGERSTPVNLHRLTSVRMHGTGGPAGSELQPVLNGVFCSGCGVKLGASYWVKRGKPLCGKTDCSRRKKLQGGGS